MGITRLITEYFTNTQSQSSAIESASSTPLTEETQSRYTIGIICGTTLLAGSLAILFFKKRLSLPIPNSLRERVSQFNQEHLLQACRNGNTLAVRFFSLFQDVNFTKRQETDPTQIVTPLYEAVKNGRINVVNLLLQGGAKASDFQLYQDESLLHIAASKGNIEILKLLIEKEAPANISNALGETPLHIAAINGQIETIKFLVSKEANIDAETGAKRTPLFVAVKHKKYDAVNTLIELGANVHTVTEKKETLLHQAVVQQDLTLVNLFIQKGVNLEAKTLKDNRTALHIAYKKGNKEIIQTLINNVADQNALETVYKLL